MEPDDDLSAPPPPLRIGLPSRLGEMLIRQGLVTSDDVQAALAEQAAGSEWRLGRLLVQRGALDDRTLVQAIAHQFHVPVVDLRLEPPTPGALGRLSHDAAVRLQALPLRLDADALVVAVADPPVRELRVAVERSTGLPVRLVLAAADELADCIDDCYRDPVDLTEPPDRHDEGARLDGAFPPPSGPPVAGPSTADPSTAEPSTADPGPVGASPETPATPEPPVASVPDEPTELQMVGWLLTESVRRGAEAVHLDHRVDGLRVRYRVDGHLVAGPTLPRDSGAVVCHRLLAAAGLAAHDDGCQEGAFPTVADGRSVTCRVTAVTSASGTHVVVRTEAAAQVRRLEDLRIGPADAAAVRRILGECRGVVAIAAPRSAVAHAVCRTLVDEVGVDDHVVVVVQGDDAPAPPGVVVLTPDGGRDDEPAPVVRTARALGADVIVLEAVGPDTVRAAFDVASSRLIVVWAEGADASDVAAALVDDVGGFLVAGMLRAVVVGAGTDDVPTAEVHLVTEDVCRAILDLPPSA